MLLSLVDSLRCPADHEASSLVLSVEEWAGPRVFRGQLGCPVCHARYPIDRGVVGFAGDLGVHRPPGAGDPPDVMRLAAQLSLTDAGGVVLLTGRYAERHDALSDLTGVTCLLVDSADSLSPAAVNFEVLDRLPLVESVLRGAAVDVPRSGQAFLAEVARCLRSGGRLVAPRQARTPVGAAIVAEDDLEWVGEITETPRTVPLRRGPPR